MRRLAYLMRRWADVVDEWDPPAEGGKRPDIHLSKCKGCGGKWRRVVEIRPTGGPEEDQ